jgi:hypothetical protein
MILAQQRGSRLRDTVMIDRVQGKRSAKDQIGSVTAALKTTRHQDTPITETPHSRRWVNQADYVIADFVDREDLNKILNDPRGAYAQAQGFALGRATDDVIITAFGAAATSGEEAGSTVAFDTTNQQIAVNSNKFGGSGSDSGLTIAKLIEARAKLEQNDLDLDQEDVFLAATPNNILNLLTTTQVTSSDFNVVKTLVQGDTDTFMGFQFRKSTRLLDNADDATNDVDCYAYTRSAMALDFSQDMRLEIDKRPDKMNTWQIMGTLGLGSVRLEEARIVRVICLKTP